MITLTVLCSQSDQKPWRNLHSHDPILSLLSNFQKVIPKWALVVRPSEAAAGFHKSWSSLYQELLPPCRYVHGFPLDVDYSLHGSPKPLSSASRPITISHNLSTPPLLWKSIRTWHIAGETPYSYSLCVKRSTTLITERTLSCNHSHNYPLGILYESLSCLSGYDGFLQPS